jgi:hypothetical protein
MMRTTIFFLFFILILNFSFLLSQKIETQDGITIVHNDKVGEWGEHPKVKLELIQTIGGLDVEDENLAFSSPSDIVLDSTGNMYILDRASNRIQKLDSEGKFITSLGRSGQGPLEFQSPCSLDIDSENNLYVFDVRNRRIQIFSSQGEFIKTIKFTAFAQNIIRVSNLKHIVMGGIIHFRRLMDETKELPKLFEISDLDGNIKKEFGELRDYKDVNVNAFANWINFDMDSDGNIIVCFQRQNRIEKYSPKGILLWKMDRVLNYGTKVMDKGYIKHSDGGVGIQMPKMNQVSTGISVDEEERIWVITLNRQKTKEETRIVMSGGGRTKVVKEGKIKKMDIYKLEIFNSDGLFLGQIPLNIEAHGIRIFNDSLFIWDMAQTKFYHFKIKKQDGTEY